jgi:hypothetical protein
MSRRPFCTTRAFDGGCAASRYLLPNFVRRLLSASKLRTIDCPCHKKRRQRFERRCDGNRHQASKDQSNPGKRFQSTDHVAN